MTIKRLWQRSTRIFNSAARLHLKTVRIAKAADAARVRQVELLEPLCEWSDFYWQSISERWSNPATTLREKEALKSAYAHMINLYTSGNEAARQADAALQDLRPKLDKQWQDGPTPDAAVENFRAVDKIMNTYSTLTSHMIEFVEMMQMAFRDKRNEDQVCETLDRLHAQLAALPSAPAQLKVTVQSDALRP